MKFISVIIAFLIISIVIILCVGPSEAEHERSMHKTYTGYIAELDYIKDERSGLCFVYRQMNQDTLFTNVPCDKVEHLIKGKYVEAHYEAAK